MTEEGRAAGRQATGDRVRAGSCCTDGGTSPAIGVPDVEDVETDADPDVEDVETNADPDATPSVETVVDAIEAAGGTAMVAAPGDLAERDLHAIAVPGERALRALATDGAFVAEASDGLAPLLPVGCEAGVRSVTAADLESAVASLREGPRATASCLVATVAVDGDPVGRVLRQVALVTAAPADISEFSVAADGVGAVDEVRADGVVVATPCGSSGYAAAGDGPLLATGTGLAVVPVAPFRTDRPRWVLPEDGVEVGIRRDEAPVSVELDGTVHRTVGQDATVRVERGGSVDVVLVDASAPPFR